MLDCVEMEEEEKAYLALLFLRRPACVWKAIDEGEIYSQNIASKAVCLFIFLVKNNNKQYRSFPSILNVQILSGSL